MTYEVRLAQIPDLEWIVKDAGWRMIHEELKKPELYDAETIRNLTLKGVREETVLIVLRHNQPIGVIGGVLVPHFLNRNSFTLAEIMWYVHKDYRTGRAGMLLLKEFANLAKRKGVSASLSLLGSSPVSDSTLERFGFKLMERNYLMEL